MVGIGCETEPVSKSDEFQAFAEKVLRAVHADGPSRVEAFEQERLELIAKLGENIVVAGAERFDAPERERRRRLCAPSGQQDRRPRRARRRLGGARPAARDAHLVRGARVGDARRRPAEVLEASARST